MSSSTLQVDDAMPVKVISNLRTYKRSIANLLTLACFENKLEIRISESLGSSLHFELINSSEKTCDVALLLTNAMNSLIQAKRSFHHCLLVRQEVIDYFTTINSFYTLELLKSINETHIPCFVSELNGSRFVALAYHDILLNTGEIEASHFTVTLVSQPFLQYRLHFVSLNDNTQELELLPSQEVMLMQAYATRKTWNSKLHLESVTQINNTIAASRVKVSLIPAPIFRCV